jgi:hypothetical protein
MGVTLRLRAVATAVEVAFVKVLVTMFAWLVLRLPAGDTDFFFLPLLTLAALD